MIVLVTGCRSGFGLHTAVLAARAGHVVFAGLRDLTTREALDRACVGLDVTPVQLDVTDPEQRVAVVNGILDQHGRIDALVNNAGVALGGFWEEVSEAEVRRVFEVNVFGVWALTQLVLPTMRAQGFGHIVQLSSASGRIALPGLGIYAGSKFALEGMSEALRHEVASLGVRVTLVEPGPYRTDMTTGPNRTLAAAAARPDSPYASRHARAEALFDRLSRTMGDPLDVAHRVVDILAAEHPRLRHPMGLSAKVRLFAIWMLPFALWERLIRYLTVPR